MPSAKRVFIQRIQSLNKSLNIHSVKNSPLNNVEHNEIARMLRNGLAVVGFAALEDFIKKRISEVLEEIGGTGVEFLDLPVKIQNAATYEALSALKFQMDLRDKAARLGYIQRHAAKIASTLSLNYEITPHAFCYDQSNVKSVTIKNTLKSFSVVDPWRQMTTLASRLGLTALPLEQSFINATKRRHKAAHVANADTPEVDLVQYIKEAFAIAIGFDCLLSKALGLLKNHDSNYLNGNCEIDEGLIKFRFVKRVDSYWKDIIERQVRAYRRSRDLASLLPDVISRASIHKQVMIEYSPDNVINNWIYN